LASGLFAGRHRLRQPVVAIDIDLMDEREADN